MKQKYKITYDLYKIWNGRKPKLTIKQLKFYKNKYFIRTNMNFAPAGFEKCYKQKIYDKRFKDKSRRSQIGLKIFPFNYEIINEHQ
tara:strand:- start:36 stop:293 length:258 start_codon:yes stop_codon:yes gene_type:complete